MSKKQKTTKFFQPLNVRQTSNSFATVANEFAAKGEKRRQDFGFNKFA